MAVEIREIQRFSEIRAAEELQKEVWGFGDRDLVPMMQLVATRHAGGLLLGAFDGPHLVGLAYGFLGWAEGKVVLHSQLLAVKEAYRSQELGYRLKLTQRQRMMDKGIACMTWTFDPLHSLNAHLNFCKLGVTSRRYCVDFYGTGTSSFLHKGIGTDRLWVYWRLDSPRVKHRIASKGSSPLYSEAEVAPFLVALENDAPHRCDLPRGAHQLRIEVPNDVNSLLRERPQLAREWRAATRKAFMKAFDAGYLLEEYYRAVGLRPFGIYVLSLGV